MRTSRVGQRQDRCGLLAMAFAVAALGACTGGPADDGALAAYPGAEEQIRDFYDANAIEGDGRCQEVVLASILGAEVVNQDAARISFRVNYRFLPSAEINAVTQECNGFAERRFMFDKDGETLVLTGMSGDQGG